MTASTSRRIAWSVGTTSILLMIGGLLLLYLDRNAVVPHRASNWSASSALDGVVNIGVPVIGILIASRRPENVIGWLFLVAGAVLALTSFFGSYAIRALIVDPGSLPAGRALAWISNWIWPVPVAVLPFLFLLFPSGQLRSRRWLAIGWVTAAALGLMMVAAFVFATSGWADPFGGPSPNPTGPILRLANVLFTVGIFALPGVMLASIVSLLFRFRGSVGEERLQLKWFVTAAALVAIAFVPQFFLSSPLASVLFTLSLLFMYAAIANAIVKYRLYDIDVVIGKTFVFASLVAFITLVYLGLVIGIGTLVGNRRSPVLSAIGAAVVAVAFQPVRLRARHLANRLVYGKRATPYEVLSEFSERQRAHIPVRTSCPGWSGCSRPGQAQPKRACGCGWVPSSGLPRPGRRMASFRRSVSAGTIFPGSPATSTRSPFATAASCWARSRSRRARATH